MNQLIKCIQRETLNVKSKKSKISIKGFFLVLLVGQIIVISIFYKHCCILTLDGGGANYECLLEGLGLGAELGGSGLQGHALLC